MFRLYRLSSPPCLTYEAAGEVSLALRPGQRVLLHCDNFDELATVVCCCSPEASFEELELQRSQRTRGRHVEGQHLPRILRLSTPQDLQVQRENTAEADTAFGLAAERIRMHGLPMKLIHTHYTFDRRLLLLHFSSENRIDFRTLLRDLAQQFHVRIELRQIGVRDETALIGGLGICGRPFCCASFLHDLSGTNVRMAKQQGVSLNPLNISGPCGRLKCCIQYEHGACRNPRCGHPSRRPDAARPVPPPETPPPTAP